MTTEVGENGTVLLFFFKNMTPLLGWSQKKNEENLKRYVVSDYVSETYSIFVDYWQDILRNVLIHNPSALQTFEPPLQKKACPQPFKMANLKNNIRYSNRESFM